MAVTVFDKGEPVLQYVARVNGPGRTLAQRSEAASMLAGAAERTTGLVVPLLSAALLPSTAEAQLYFYECRTHWFKILKYATIMTGMVMAAGTLGAIIDIVIGIGFLPSLIDYTAAIWDLVGCVRNEDAKRGGGGGTPPGGSPPPPYPQEPYPPGRIGTEEPHSNHAALDEWIDSGLRQLAANCGRGAPQLQYCR